MRLSPITAASLGGIEFIARRLLAGARPPCYPHGMTEAAIQRAASQPKLPPKAPRQVWRDSAGRLSALRIVVLAFLFLPWAIATYDFNFDPMAVGARPLNNVIHRTGYWALVFLLVSLAITPLRRIARFNQLVDVRRMIGVGAFVYAAVHILLFIADQKFDLWKAASEIALRLYLTIGFVALLGLAALAVTSTDGMVRRLGGKRWQRLPQEIKSTFFNAGVEGGNRVALMYGFYSLRSNRTRIHAVIHLKQSDTGLRLTVNHSPYQWCPTAIIW